MNEDHPNTQKNSWSCYAAKAIAETDSSVNFAFLTQTATGNLVTVNFRLFFLLRESATGLNTPGGVWAMASSQHVI